MYCICSNKSLDDKVGERLDAASVDSLLSLPELDYVVHRWKAWSSSAGLKQKFEALVNDDDLLLALLDKFVNMGYRESDGQVEETYRLSMGPLAAIMDLEKEEPRIRALQSRSNPSVRQSVSPRCWRITSRVWSVCEKESLWTASTWKMFWKRMTADVIRLDVRAREKWAWCMCTPRI